MTRPQILGVVAFATVLGASTAWSDPPLNVTALVAAADVVVVGKIVSLVEAGGAPRGPRVLKGAIEVDAVVKGPEVGIVKFAVDQGRVDATPADECRLFFLIAGADDHHFVGSTDSSVVAACGVRFDSSHDPLERATSAIGQAARSTRLSREARLEAIAALGSGKRATAVAVLRRVLRDPDRRIQISAAAALLQLGDTAPLPLAEAALLHGSLDLTEGETSSLRSAIASGISDGTAIPSLVRLLAAPDREVRSAAATALGHTRSAQAIEPLSRALDDAGVEVRYAAARALAELAGAPEWAVTLDAFRIEPDRYLSPWREWAAARAR